MKRYIILLCGAVAIFQASPAFAHHCERDIVAVDSAAGSTNVGPTLFGAAAGVTEGGMAACDWEDQQMATADPTSPLLDPNYVSVGRSMLINAAELFSSQ